MSSTRTAQPPRLPCRRPLGQPTQGEPSASTKGKSERPPKLRRRHPGIYTALALLEEVKDATGFTEAAWDFIAAYKTCWDDILDSARSVKLISSTALRVIRATGLTACEDSFKRCREAKRPCEVALTAAMDVIRGEVATLEHHYRVVMSAACKDKPLPGIPNTNTHTDKGNGHFFDARCERDGVQPSVLVLPPTASSNRHHAAAPSTHAKADSISTSSTLTLSSSDSSVFSHSLHTKNSSVSSTSTGHTDYHNALPLELVLNSVFEEQQALKRQRLEEPTPEPEQPLGNLNRLKQKFASSTLSLPGLSNKSTKPSKAPAHSAGRQIRADHSELEGRNENLDGFLEANRETFYGDPRDGDRQVKRRNSDLAPHSLVVGSNGEVERATIQGLLCIATSEDQRDNHHLRSILLNEFRRFASPIDFLAFMRRRYRKNYTYQLRVAKLLLLWVHSHWQPQDIVAFDAIVDFLEKMEKDEITSATVLANIRSALDHPRLGKPFPSSFVISGKAIKAFSPMDILSIQCDYRWGVAVQVTFTASEVYRRVDKSLLIRYWMADKSGKQKMAQESADNWKMTEVLAIPAFEEALAKWVSYTITQGDDVTTRAQLIGFWLDIAEYCWELCNFSSASRIFCGVATSCITSMRETILRVDEQYKVIYHDLECRLSSVKNYAEYRSALNSAREQHHPFVPLSDCLVHDISMGVENHKQVAVTATSDSAQRRQKPAIDTANMLDVSYTHLESVKQVYDCLESTQSFGDLSVPYPIYENQLIEAARREPKSTNGLDSAGRPLPNCEAPKLWNFVLEKNAYIAFRTPDGHPGARSRVSRKTSIARKAKSAARSIKDSIGAMRDRR